MDPVKSLIDANRDNFITLPEPRLKVLQNLLLSMIRDYDEFCRAKGLEYYLGGGSALGAVRHNGIIPWDDDVDIVMPRQSYEVLKREFEDYFQGKYRVEAPNTHCNGVYAFLKIKLVGTVFREIICDDEHCEVFLDIFPLEYVSNNSFVRFFQTHTYVLMRDISYTILYAKQYKKKIKPRLDRCDGKTKFMLKAGYGLGQLLSIIPARCWMNKLDRMVAKNKPSNYVTIPTGMQGPKKETFLKEYYMPARKGEFNGMEIMLPNRVEDILTRFYGDYMTPPPVDKRARHFLIEVDLGKYEPGEVK